MEDATQAYTPVPYGWFTYAAAAARWIVRSLRLNPGLKDERAAALEILECGHAGPHAR